MNTAFDGHATAMSGVMTCTRYSGRSPSGPSIDQTLASIVDWYGAWRAGEDMGAVTLGQIEAFEAAAARTAAA